VTGNTQLSFNSTSEEYLLAFNLSSIEATSLKMFYKDPLSAENVTADSGEDLAASIESSMQIEGVLF